MRVIGLLVVSLTMAGCATMTKEECLVANWHTLGFEDGANGHTFDYLAQRRKACAEYGVSPNLTQYQQGRNAGLRQYCLPQRGFSLGESGEQYRGVCPTELEPSFLDAFRTGSELRRHRLAVEDIKQQLHAREYALEQLYEKVRDKEAVLVSNSTTVETRVLLLSDLKRLSEEKGEIEAEIDALLQDLVNAERDLASFEQVIADLGSLSLAWPLTL